LIRAIEPIHGIPKMLERRAIPKLHYRISSGPGMLSQALGLTLESNNKSLITSRDIWIERFGKISDNQIVVGPRIGVDYADEDALLPWRFHLKHTKWVSKG
jgi:DNA-3-methyladenine glycosylase